MAESFLLCSTHLGCRGLEGISCRVIVELVFGAQDWKLGERYSMNMIADINSGCQSLSSVELKSSLGPVSASLP